MDSGKSTLLGVLTQGELDNGRGRARLNLFRHLHEIQTGRTSSISFEILGFNSKGEVRTLPVMFNVESAHSHGKSFRGIKMKKRWWFVEFVGVHVTKCEFPANVAYRMVSTQQLRG